MGALQEQLLLLFVSLEVMAATTLNVLTIALLGSRVRHLVMSCRICRMVRVGGRLFTTFSVVARGRLQRVTTCCLGNGRMFLFGRLGVVWARVMVVVKCLALLNVLVLSIVPVVCIVVVAVVLELGRGHVIGAIPMLVVVRAIDIGVESLSAAR